MLTERNSFAIALVSTVYVPCTGSIHFDSIMIHFDSITFCLETDRRSRLPMDACIRRSRKAVADATRF